MATAFSELHFEHRSVPSRLHGHRAPRASTGLQPRKLQELGWWRFDEIRELWVFAMTCGSRLCRRPNRKHLPSTLEKRGIEELSVCVVGRACRCSSCAMPSKSGGRYRQVAEQSNHGSHPDLSSHVRSARSESAGKIRQVEWLKSTKSWRLGLKCIALYGWCKASASFEPRKRRT